MNGDVAHQVATRSTDRPTLNRPPSDHRYCWACSTYKPEDLVAFGGRCWDCRHARTRARGVRTAIRFLTARNPRAALLALAISLDDQARAEGIILPAHQTVTSHAHRAALRDALERSGHLVTAARASRSWWR